MAGHRLSTVDAIVIKRKNVGEADRLLVLFTKEHGKLQVVAKGVRKISSRRAPHIEVFNRIIATVHDKKILTEATSLESFVAIQKDLQRIHAAYYLCELIDGLLPLGQVHADIFALLLDAFGALAKVKKERTEELRARFAAALLTKLGYMEKGKKFKDNDIDVYVEQILERRLKTVRMAAQLR